MKPTVTLFWFRRDLRLHDNAGLYEALKHHTNVLPIFIFDRAILDKLEERADRRVTFIHQQLVRIHESLENRGSTLRVFYGYPESVFEEIEQTYQIEAVYTNHDYEPYATDRDQRIQTWLDQRNVSLHTCKDQCIFERSEVVKDNGEPYTVYSPYSRKWKKQVDPYFLQSYPTESYLDNLYPHEPSELISLESMKFIRKDDHLPSSDLDQEVLKHYHERRDIPSIKGTSRLSVHLRFGTLSIRDLASAGQRHNEKWLNELIWRDFYFMILHHFPHVVGKAFKPAYDRIPWRNDPEGFEAWCNGETGYPIVDAGMRELNETGFMHNRVRMIVSSFLTKHLLIDWRWGEAYFAKKLTDFELSSNNGGWQWAAGSGCDAAPYFRVFNPELQTQKFDPELKYVRKWVPEFQELTYINQRIVDHKFARNRAIETYKTALSS